MHQHQGLGRLEGGRKDQLRWCIEPMRSLLCGRLPLHARLHATEGILAAMRSLHGAFGGMLPRQVHESVHQQRQERCLHWLREERLPSKHEEMQWPERRGALSISEGRASDYQWPNAVMSEQKTFCTFNFCTVFYCSCCQSKQDASSLE